MRHTLSTEWFWIRHRLAAHLAALLAAVIAVAVPVGRWISTHGDLDAAIAKAHDDAAESLAIWGVEVPAEAVFVEPRYPLAEQLPLDVAAVAVAVALIGLVAAALLVGGEWRTGTVRLSFTDPAQRGRPTAARILTCWWGWTAVAAILLGITAGGLLLVGQQRGLTEGMTVTRAVFPLLRGIIIAGLGALLGAALGTIFRSGTVVIVLLLVYVIVAEIVLLGLGVGTGYHSPGSRLLQWLVSADGQLLPYACGGAMRCSELYVITAGPPLAYLAAAMTACLATVAAVIAARRPIWR
ncbi:MAG: hypothetical protein LBB54_06430 [Cellulomonadaceae bacterium]|jgi:ABC-type transport system involved in multi-copper enzyme maturation permease subunit|nr:hypothetical protein [Cellulomonadaceae bacterium]